MPLTVPPGVAVTVYDANSQPMFNAVYSRVPCVGEYVHDTTTGQWCVVRSVWHGPDGSAGVVVDPPTASGFTPWWP